MAISMVLAAMNLLFSMQPILAKGICMTMGGFEPGQQDKFQLGGQGGSKDPVPNKNQAIIHHGTTPHNGCCLLWWIGRRSRATYS